MEWLEEPQCFYVNITLVGRAGEREQMASARCMLGFITLIFQNNKGTSPNPKLVVFSHTVSCRRCSWRWNLIKHGRHTDPSSITHIAVQCNFYSSLKKLLLPAHSCSEVSSSSCSVCEANTGKWVTAPQARLSPSRQREALEQNVVSQQQLAASGSPFCSSQTRSGEWLWCEDGRDEEQALQGKKELCRSMIKWTVMRPFEKVVLCVCEIVLHIIQQSSKLNSKVTYSHTELFKEHNFTRLRRKHR